MVEDDLVNQRVTRRMLEKLGCTVELAENGAIAVERCAESHYNLVLMDLQMPVMDGLTATRARIRRGQPDRSTCPIVALTANVMQEDRQQCIEAGMNDPLPKPFSADELRTVLLRWATEPKSSR